MNFKEINILNGENEYQKAELEKSEKMIDYNTSHNLSYTDIISISKGLDVISEFYDVNAAVTTTGAVICAVALGQSVEDAVVKVMDSNPIDFISSVITLSQEVNSEIAKLCKNSKIIVAPKFTQKAIDFLTAHDIVYVTINTPLKDYKKFLSNDIKITPLGTLNQTPNLSELNKESFKVASKTKPTVEQIEDAIFAWKVAKHANSQAIVIAKDLKTTAVSQGLQSASVEYALDYSCDMPQKPILASDMPITIHDINVAAQGRIGLIIIPTAGKEIIDAVNKFNIALITTGFTNILF